MHDRFQGTRGLATQHQVAQVNPSQDRRGIDGAGGVGVKFQSPRYRQPGVLRLRKVSQFKVAPVQIAEKTLRLQVVGSVADDGAAILEKG